MKLRSLGILVTLLISLGVQASPRNAQKHHSRFSVALETVVGNRTSDTVNWANGNSFQIDLKRGEITMNVEVFEKVIDGQTHGSDIRIKPQKVTIPLNCCYNRITVYEYVIYGYKPDGETYKTVYGLKGGHRSDHDPWKVLSPRTKVQ